MRLDLKWCQLCRIYQLMNPDAQPVQLMYFSKYCTKAGNKARPRGGLGENVDGITPKDGNAEEMYDMAPEARKPGSKLLEALMAGIREVKRPELTEVD